MTNESNASQEHCLFANESDDVGLEQLARVFLVRFKSL